MRRKPSDLRYLGKHEPAGEEHRRKEAVRNVAARELHLDRGAGQKTDHGNLLALFVYSITYGHMTVNYGLAKRKSD